MKKTFFFILFIGLVLSGCDDPFLSFPEPELPVVDIVFNTATYDAVNHSIILDFHSSIPYTGIFENYNTDKGFNIALYITNSNSLSIRRTSIYENKISIFLAPGTPYPSKLFFNIHMPFYLTFYSVVVSKAFIYNKELPVL